MSASWALQKAIRARLTGDAALMAMIAGVFDHVPQDAAYPYVTIGEDDTRPFAGKTFAGTRHDLTLRAWSRGQGRREAKAIIERLRVLLDGQGLTLDDHALIDLRLTATGTTVERDGLTYLGTARLRAVTQDV